MGPVLSLGGGAVLLEVPLGAEQGLAQGGVLWGRDCALSCLGPPRLLEVPAGSPNAFPQWPSWVPSSLPSGLCSGIISLARLFLT